MTEVMQKAMELLGRTVRQVDHAHDKGANEREVAKGALALLDEIEALVSENISMFPHASLSMVRTAYEAINENGPGAGRPQLLRIGNYWNSEWQ